MGIACLRMVNKQIETAHKHNKSTADENCSDHILVRNKLHLPQLFRSFPAFVGKSRFREKHIMHIGVFEQPAPLYKKLKHIVSCSQVRFCNSCLTFLSYDNMLLAF